ncbi:MAG: TIGR04076 family protein [Gaiellales bacterium]
MSGVRVRATVESMSYSACGLELGDWFEIDETGLSLPPGKGFCYFAIAAVVPFVSGRLGEPDAREWLAASPRIACPDPPENLVMRLDLVQEPG